MPMIPMYDTKTFSQIWEEASDFKADYLDNGISPTIHYGETSGGVTYKDNITLLYYLLYASYGNSPIANFDETQFKYKVFSTIFQYGPTWEKRLDIQEKLRALSEADLLQGARQISNHAFNPSQDPSTSGLEELPYINEQNALNYKRNKLDAYGLLWDLLRVDVTKVFLDQFRKLFRQFVQPMVTAISETEIEKINNLEKSVNDLGNSKRFLDGFVHSGTRQPYSLLKDKLDELEANYSIVSQGVNSFKEYVDSLKKTAEEAYNMISVYYYQTKEAEMALREIDVESYSNNYQEKIDAVYEVLNDIYDGVQSKPIDIEDINNKIANLKNIANPMFEEIDNKTRTCKVAEKALMSLNRDLGEQDIAQQSKQLETSFYKGEFQNVYSQANSIFRNRHSENESA